MTRFLQGALALAALLSLASGARQLSSISWASHETASAVLKEQREFDYFMFVRQWPGSFCSTHECPLVSNRGFHFTIHGLWPNYDDGTWPQFCDPSYKFDEEQLEDLMDDLESEWPSVYDSDETFWEHEWSKHGTCALEVFSTERSFFKHVLKLQRRYDLAAAFRAADILPSKDTVYRSMDLVNAIEDMYGVRPLVHCSGKLLSEIWMCFGKDLKPFDCDTSHERNNCQQQVMIPPFKGAQALAGTAEQEGEQRRQE